MGQETEPSYAKLTRRRVRQAPATKGVAAEERLATSVGVAISPHPLVEVLARERKPLVVWARR